MLPAPNPIKCKKVIQKHIETGPATICMADADGLKGVNDKYGHLAGDQYLEHVFRILQQCFPEFIWDRYGGDEFIGVAQGEITPDASQAVRETVQILNQTIKIGYSLGAVHSAPNDTVDLVMAMADAAMYEAKHVHHGGLLMFNPSKRVGLIGPNWEMEWYIPLIRNKIRFFLGYELGDVDFVFAKHRLIQEGVYVETPEELKGYIMEQTEQLDEFNFPDTSPKEDEFGNWGLPEETLEWRSRLPESEWEQTGDIDQGVKLNIETGNKQSWEIPRTEVKTQPEPEKKKKGSRFQLPHIPEISLPSLSSLSSLSLPSLPSFRMDKEEKNPDLETVTAIGNPTFQGKILWIWGDRSHEIDYVFAKYLARSNQVLYLDGDFKNPQHQGDWSVSWALETPARPPSDYKKEKNLTIWGLGKRPPKLANIKSLWDNALYSLTTVDKTIVVGAGKMGPPPHVDAILFVTEEDLLLASPAVAVKPSDSMEEVVRKAVEVFEKI